jgi:Protein of unknown function (DUF4031)
VTVYVDDAFILYRGMRMSHMIADTTEELLEMVDRIGVQRKWIQYPGTHREHFDIASSKRDLAIAAGAVGLSTRELGRKILERRT